MYNKGKNLIFLISQPRAGSTLTQRLLGAHSAIHTQSEPWILLHPLHALKPQNIVSAYDSNLYSIALKKFTESLPGGLNKYKKDIASVYSGFYQKILQHKEKQLFLDKTPRYFHIIDELYDFYPEAKFIILWRNPAAVISSIINSWTQKKLYILSEFKEDLLSAPNLMLEGSRKLGNKVYSIYYEDLIENPLQSLSKLCNYLGISYEDNMLRYNKSETEKWFFGDQDTVYKKTEPDPEHSNKWIKTLNNPQTWRLVDDYISYLGEDTLSKMNYSYKEIKNILQNNKPNLNILNHSLSLNQLLENNHSVIVEKSKLETLVEQKTLTINNLSSNLINKDNELAKLNKTIELINAELIGKDNELKELSKIVEIKNGELKDKDSKLSELISAIKQINSNLQNKDNELAELNKKIEIKDRELKDKDIRLLELDNAIKLLNSELQNKNSKQLELKNQIDKKNKKIKEVEDSFIQKDKMLKSIINSYSFKLGYLILWPIKKIFRRI